MWRAGKIIVPRQSNYKDGTLLALVRKAPKVNTETEFKCRVTLRDPWEG